MSRSGLHYGSVVAVMLCVMCGLGCAPNDDKGTASSVSAYSKPNAPPPPVGVSGPVPSPVPAARGPQGVTAQPAGPVVSAAAADQQGQAFNFARDEESDPFRWLPQMAKRSTSVVLGKVVNDKTLPYVPGQATKHLSTIQSIETWVGAPQSAIDVTWTETSGFQGLQVNKTYVLFLAAGNGEVWCIDDHYAVMAVTTGSVVYRGQSLSLSEARQITAAAK